MIFQLSDCVHTLPNSAYVVGTAAGDVLVNCPPETLKYLLAQGLEPPPMIVLPPDMPAGRQLGSGGFVREGVNYASVEFLLYANFFGHGRRTRLITPTTNQAHRLYRIIAETINGPTDLAAYGDFPWLRQECTAVGYYPPLGRAPGPDDLAEISSLENGGGELGQGVTLSLEADQFIFRQDGDLVATLPTAVNGTPQPLTLAPARPLLRQELTLQFIGGSDGFDPAGITTCFLAYLGDGSQAGATLFDAAAYLQIRLGNMGVSPRQISEVVLSHVHEDHLAGLPELLLMGGKRVRLLTSDTIYVSLLRVLSAMLDLPEAEVAALFDFHPLNPGQPLLLDGRLFEATYAVHTIPTIAVRVSGLCYSGDMRYDESWFDELVERGTLSPERREELITFADGAKVLVQDAGGGPVHTTVTADVLKALAAKSQRVILAHTKRESLTAVDDGMRSVLEVADSGYVSGIGEMLVPVNEEGQGLETFSLCPLFSRLSRERRLQLAKQAQLFEWSDGQTIIQDGEPSDGWTYVVHSGLVEIQSGGDVVMILGRGRSVGERGALQGEARTNSLIAKGNVQLLGLAAEVFCPLAEEMGLLAAFDRADWLWRQPLFEHFSWAALLDLALDFNPHTLTAGDGLFNYGDPGYECFLLVSGAIAVMDKEGRLLQELNSPGLFFGGRSALYHTLRNASAHAVQHSEVWALTAVDLQRWQMVYPNILLHMRVIESKRQG